MKSLINFLFLFVLTFLILPDSNAQQSVPNEKSFIGLNSPFSAAMLDLNLNLRKIDILLDAKSSNTLEDKGLYLGASLIAIADYQHTNTDSKFAYLMRHPTSNNSIGQNASEVVLHSAQVSLTSSVNSWITAYAELLYDPEQSFGAGTITSLGRNQIQLRKGIVLIGNLQKFPLYFAIGKMDTPFGQTGSVSPFTNSTMWHAFGGLGYSGVLGFKKYGISASFSAIQGGAQFRALHVPVDSTSVPSRINNFAIDLNYTLPINEMLQITAGGSYLKGSAYCQPFPVVHFNPCEECNPAYTYYATVKYMNMTFKGSFAKTVKEWPGTFNPAPPLNEFTASKVSSLDFGVKYDIMTGGPVNFAISGEFSNFRAGPEESPWERQNQIVGGFCAMFDKSTRLFLEVFNTQGYAPLNFVSGGNMENPGETHSDRDASSVGLVMGANITL